MAEGIIFEIQKEALDEDVSLESLLRKAYFVARKLKLKDLEKWLNQEQNGYNDKIPDYRILSGELKALNPARGWVPLIMPADIANISSKMPFGKSIAAIVDIYDSADSSFSLSVNGEITDALNEMIDGYPTKYCFTVSRSELYRIMSTVRNKILDWAILLEENGIIGEGMSFTDFEKNVASSLSIINNYTNNFYSDVKGIDLDQG